MNDRAPRFFWIALCAIGAIPRLVDLWFFPVALTNRDFSSFYAAAKYALGGHSPYDPAFAAYSTSLYGADYGLPFVYPPHALLLVAPLGWLPYALAFVLWNLAGLAFFTWAARPYAKVLPIFLPATLVCLEFGQMGLFVSGLWLLAFRPSASALAALTMKPHIGFLAGFTALNRQGLIAVAWLAGVIALTTALFGLGIWPGFIRAATAQTTIAPFRNIGPLWSYGWGGQIAFAGAAAVLLWRRFNVFTAATAALLISPYSFTYDMPAANLGFAVALATSRSPLERGILALGFLSPALAMFGPAIVPPILLAGLWVQAGSWGTLPRHSSGTVAPGSSRRCPKQKVGYPL